MSTALDVAVYLQAQGIGVIASSSDWSIAVSREPATPANCITIYDTPGSEPDTDDLDIQSSFQIRVRCTDYETGMAKAVAARDALILPSRPMMNGNTYDYVFNTISINSLGRDDTDRFLLVATYRTTLERSP